jgi:molybdopterin/thiamine biosynthesis adenylyltransferase
MSQDRHDRQIRFFTKEGQDRLSTVGVTIVGVGGLGSHVVQQLAFLGVENITIIDDDVSDITNLNRLIGAHHNDHLSKLTKAIIMERMVQEINPAIKVTRIEKNLLSKESFDAVKNADFVFGCVDDDGPRLVLTEICSAYERPYLDLASEIISDSKLSYGGRICFSDAGQGCLSCLDQISTDEVSEYFMSKESRTNKRMMYGLPIEEIRDSGPSVVTLNGVVASLATTEFMVQVTGIRQARRLVNYHGHSSKVTVITDEPRPDCYYCKSVYGMRQKSDVERYLS